MTMALSRSGSVVMLRRTYSFIFLSSSFRWIAASFAVSSGHTPGQLVKINVTNTSLPRVLLNLNGLLSWLVSVKSGTVFCTTRRPISLGALGGIGILGDATEGRRPAANRTAAITWLRFEFELINHIKSFGAVGQIAVHKVGAVIDLLFA